MEREGLVSWLERVGRPRILVLGDLMLDRYTWGNTERVSPEAPVLVLDADSQEVRLGGAASVAFLARGLDAEISAAGVLGADPEGRVVRKLLDESGIDHGLVLEDPSRPTTVKERFVGRAAGRHPHQILRVDHERREPLAGELERLLSSRIVARLSEHQAVLVSDYNKGVCTPGLVACVIAQADKIGLPVIVDPARISDYARYQGATILTPNRVEAVLATGRKIHTSSDAQVAGYDLCGQCRAEALLITLDAEGMALVRKDGSSELVPTKPRPVYDVTGAGDMVLAMVGLCQAAGTPLAETAGLANAAAGLEVEKLGVAPVSRAEIKAELVGTKRTGLGKLIGLDEMAKLADSYRRAGRTIVFTNGCFDLLHVGHATYLEEAAGLGDVLVVAVNSDRSVRRIKGSTRPVVGQDHRANMLAALQAVDHVLIFDEDTPHRLLRRLRPDVLVKGGTYAPDQVVGHEVVEAYGGKVCVTGKVEGVSTTKILALLRDGKPEEPAQASPAEVVPGSQVQR
jgi:D-beta-D-heptose 7-phosphate kinase/D-beta-D-heptose 1-phosphate adenosyltransferase